MVRAVVLAGVLVSCYTAHPSPGAPCTEDHECPMGLQCIANVCNLAGIADAKRADAMIDAIPPDTAMPGPNGWFPATPVPGVNTASNETDPSFTADQLTIVLTSDRPGGTGGTDLYLGTRTTQTDAFTVRELAELDSTVNEQSPEISADGLTIYFTSNRGASSQLYKATRAAITDPFGAPAVATVHNGVNNGNANIVQVGISPAATVAILVRVKGTTNQMLQYTIETNGVLDNDVDDTTLELGTSSTAPSLDTGPAHAYLSAATPAQIYVSTSLSGTFSTPMAIDDFNSTGTRNAAPSISADDSFIMFERDGDILQASK